MSNLNISDFTPNSVVLNRVLDSLDLRISRLGTPSKWLCDSLEDWRKHKRDKQSHFDTPEFFIEIPNIGTFRLLSSGKRPYEFILVNPEVCDIRIWNPNKWSSSKNTGQFYVSFRSSYLQTMGSAGALSIVKAIEEQFYESFSEGIGFTYVSRADLAVDFEHEGFDWSDLSKFNSRSRSRSVITDESELLNQARELLSSPPHKDNKGGYTYNDHQLSILRSLLPESSTLTGVSYGASPETMYFGKFGSAVYARIYNKLKSLRIQNKGYMCDIWETNGWCGDTGVWRLEFSLSGKFLKQTLSALCVDESGELLDLRDFSSFLLSIPSIWRYLTVEWLRHTEPNEDTNRWRWPASELWISLTHAYPLVEPALRYRPDPKIKRDQLLAQARGCLVTLSAYDSAVHDDPHKSLAEFIDIFDDYHFLLQIVDRKKLLGLDEFTDETFDDTSYSAQIRAERMIAEGAS